MQKDSRVMIGTMEAVSILTVSRIFTAVTYSSSNYNTNITTSMLAFLVGFLVDLVILLPFLWLSKKHDGGSLIECATQRLPILGKALAGVFSIIFIIICATNLSAFARFICTQVLDISPWPILFLMTLAVAYCAYMGIEALGRFSNIVLIITVLSIAVVFFLFLGQYKIDNFYSPFEDGITTVFSQGLWQASSAFEVLSAVIIAPIVKGRKKRGYVWFLLLSLILLETMIFTIGGVLGDYANITTYSFYSLIRVSGVSVFERIDAVYVAAWVMLGFVKAGYYLLLSKNMFDSAVKKTQNNTSLVVCTTLAFVLAGVFSLKPDLSLSLTQALKQWALPILVIIIPLALLMLKIRRRRVET